MNKEGYVKHVQALRPDQQQRLKSALENSQEVCRAKAGFSRGFSTAVEIQGHCFTMNSLADFESLCGILNIRVA